MKWEDRAIPEHMDAHQYAVREITDILITLNAPKKDQIIAEYGLDKEEYLEGCLKAMVEILKITAMTIAERKQPKPVWFDNLMWILSKEVENEDC